MRAGEPERRGVVREGRAGRQPDDESVFVGGTWKNLLWTIAESVELHHKILCGAA